MSKALSDIITELVWTAAHNNKNYGIKELENIKSMHPTVDMKVLKRIVQHAKRTPKSVDWEIIRQKMIQ